MEKVKSTYKFPNGMVVTYGYNDKQIPELQGLYDKALHEKIKARSDDPDFLEWFWGDRFS